MSLRYLVLIVISGLVLIPAQSFSLLAEQSPEELYQNHHVIVIGKIVSAEIVTDRTTLYEIMVVESIKNSQKNNIISAVGNGIDCNGIASCMRSSIDRVFDVGDTAILYLNYGFENFEVSPYSRTISPDEYTVPSEFARPGWHNFLLIVGLAGTALTGIIVVWRKKRK